jgi:NAD(P)-dependent dehydrogenase (short-subunit alcohol dehydrogenase family)
MATDMGAEAAEHLPEGLMDTYPIRRIATLEEVAAAVSYLVGPTAGYTAGTVIDVSGGVLV